jgi:hypothetical protein
MNNIFTLSAGYNGVEGTFEDNPRYFKGETELIFSFSEANSGTYDIIKIVADFNDGSPLYTKEFEYNDSKAISDIPIKHTYYPISTSDNIFYYPTFYIYYSNFKKFIYQTPIRITKESFYSKYKRLTVNSAQFVDDFDNSLFLTLQSLDGDILNTKIK